MTVEGKYLWNKNKNIFAIFKSHTAIPMIIAIYVCYIITIKLSVIMLTIICLNISHSKKLIGWQLTVKQMLSLR